MAARNPIYNQLTPFLQKATIRPSAFLHRATSPWDSLAAWEGKNMNSLSMPIPQEESFSLGMIVLYNWWNWLGNFLCHFVPKEDHFSLDILKGCLFLIQVLVARWNLNPLSVTSGEKLFVRGELLARGWFDMLSSGSIWLVLLLDQSEYTLLV